MTRRMTGREGFADRAAQVAPVLPGRGRWARRFKRGVLVVGALGAVGVHVGFGVVMDRDQTYMASPAYERSGDEELPEHPGALGVVVLHTCDALPQRGDPNLDASGGTWPAPFTWSMATGSPVSRQLFRLVEQLVPRPVAA